MFLAELLLDGISCCCECGRSVPRASRPRAASALRRVAPGPGWAGSAGAVRTGSGWDQAISQPCSLAHRATFGCHGTNPCPVGWPVPGGQNPPFTICRQHHTRFTIQQWAPGASAHSRRRKQVEKIIKDLCVALKPVNNCAVSAHNQGERVPSRRIGGKEPAVCKDIEKAADLLETDVF